jgi:NAD-dependent dihydropyrimidine dehydrogenase PreA subunit
MPFNVTVNRDKCKGCEECLEVCTVQVFEMQDGKSVPMGSENCIGCESCIAVCKEEAIHVASLERDLSEIARLLLGDIL